MNTMMNLNENVLAAVVGGDLDIETLYRADKPVIPEEFVHDIVPEPFPAGPAFIVNMDPIICNPSPVEPGIRLWDVF